MTDNERLVRAAMPLVQAITPADVIRRSQRVDRRIGNDSTLILDDREFYPLKSPDGSTWRITVSNTGTITATKE